MITKGVKTRTGRIYQSGTPKYRRGMGPEQANGLLLRGVVTATYETDNTGHPFADSTDRTPVAVYCDVLVFPSIPNQRWFGLKEVLVSQDRGGIHSDSIWKPRATTMSIAGDAVDQASNPAYWDGDHVLIGFINDSLNQPIILRGLPHPAVDTGRENADLGRRMKLKVTDGNPNFQRHRGVHWGVSDIGNFVVDTTFANDGELDESGYEADPPTDGKGSVAINVPQDAAFDIQLFDMSTPTSPVLKAKLTFDKNECTLDIRDSAGKFYVKVDNGDTILSEHNGANATLKLGDGAVAAAVADHLQTLYASLQTALENHTHLGVTSGAQATATAGPVFPSWDSNINSSKLTLPDT